MSDTPAPVPVPDTPPPTLVMAATEVPERPRVRGEFIQDFMVLTHAIDNVLVAHHGLRAALKDPHPPFNVAISTALTFYGNGPLFHLWCECKAVEELRLAWTGKAS